MNAVGAPPTRPRQVTRPYLVRCMVSRYEPAAVESAVVGFHELVWVSASIAVHVPW